MQAIMEQMSRAHPVDPKEKERHEREMVEIQPQSRDLVYLGYVASFHTKLLSNLQFSTPHNNNSLLGFEEYRSESSL